MIYHLESYAYEFLEVTINVVNTTSTCTEVNTSDCRCRFLFSVVLRGLGGLLNKSDGLALAFRANCGCRVSRDGSRPRLLLLCRICYIEKLFETYCDSVMYLMILRRRHPEDLICPSAYP